VELACLSTQFMASGMSLADFLDACVQSEVGAVEVGVANRMGSDETDAHNLLRSPESLREFRRAFADRGLRIAALNCFGNPLHPIADRAAEDVAGVRATIELAAELGIRTVVTASGCPGDQRWPVWITWPLYWAELEPQQWKTAISTWSELATVAAAAQVDLCLKLHPGQIVHNTSTFLRLAAACGPRVMADLDPAHCFYLGMDPIQIVERLGRRLGHVHAKDAVLDPDRMAVDGPIDTSPLDQLDRAWRCAAVGEGHDVGWWKQFLASLSAAGYAGLVSIEHEDAALSADAALPLNAGRLRETGLLT
jgi:sugar phosphate isomerase/epimerase